MVQFVLLTFLLAEEAREIEEPTAEAFFDETIALDPSTYQSS
jgi:hypothetical protein